MLLVIGNKNYSSWSLRPWLALKKTNAVFQEKLISLYAQTTDSEIAKYSPAGRVPVLLDGDQAIWDSLAICEYLNEKFPQAALWPLDKKARAHARSISSEMHSGFLDLRHNLPMNIRKEIKTTIKDEAKDDIRRILEIWSSYRKNFGGQGSFLFGDFSIADAMFAPVVLRFYTYDIEMDPVSASYAKSVLEWPAMQEWIQEAKKEVVIIPAFER